MMFDVGHIIHNTYCCQGVEGIVCGLFSKKGMSKKFVFTIHTVPKFKPTAGKWRAKMRRWRRRMKMMMTPL